MTSVETTHRQTFARYLDQPAEMPAAVRRAIESHWEHPVHLYALADLEHARPSAIQAARTWVALGPKQLALARASADGSKVEDLVSLDRTRIREVREMGSLSFSTLALLEGPDAPALAVLKYTHRQRRAMENLRFVLEQQLKGHEVDLSARSGDAAYAEAMTHAIREAQASVAGDKLAVVLRLLEYLKPYRRQLAFGMAGAALMTCMSLVPPFLGGFLVDGVIRPFQEGRIGLGEASRLAWRTVAAIGATYLLKELFAWIRFRTMTMLGEYVASDLREEVYEHLQKLSVSYFSGKQTGSIISRVSSDTDRIWDFIAFGVVEVSISLLMLTGLGAVLLSLDWRLGLGMTIPVPLILFAIYRHGEGMQKLFLRAWRKWSGLTDVLSDTIPGIRVVKAFGQEKHENRRFRGRNHELIGEFMRIHHSWTGFWPKLMLSIGAVILVTWFQAVPRLLGSGWGARHPLSAGTFVSFLLYMTMFVQPIEVIGQMARMLNRATSSAHRIFELLDTEPTIVDVPEPRRLEPVAGRVTFENVSFGYDGVRQILKGVSFDVEPGEMVGLVGPSGGGKTTTTNLITRFYEATGGRVLIDGVDVRELDTAHFRRQVGMVLQEPYLFYGTILDNIRYGMPGATLEQVVEAARAANAHDFIVKLPQGYDTTIGERGHTLSGGERQRVSIARAILMDPRILILDEATSAVDTETERKIQEALDRLVEGRTVFAIAHRLSTLTRASRLFVIEDGRIAEQGTHAELLAKPQGVYAKLHRLQQQLHETRAV